MTSAKQRFFIEMKNKTVCTNRESYWQVKPQITCRDMQNILSLSLSLTHSLTHKKEWHKMPGERKMEDLSCCHSNGEAERKKRGTSVFVVDGHVARSGDASSFLPSSTSYYKMAAEA